MRASESAVRLAAAAVTAIERAVTDDAMLVMARRAVRPANLPLNCEPDLSDTGTQEPLY